MSEVKEKVKGERKKVKADDPISLCRAVVDGSNFDETTNSVPVVFATENPVLTRDWAGDLFYEVLSMNPAHIRQDRINGSLPALDNHDKNGSVSKVVVGRVQDPQIVNKEYRATIRFSKRQSNEELVSDVKDKIIVDVSAGYRVYAYRDISQPGDKYPTLLAIDWEPTEVSMVPVPADYKAKIRSAQYAPAPTVETPAAQAPETENQIKVNNNNRALKMGENEVVIPGSEITVLENDRGDKNTAEVVKVAAAAERKRGLEIRDAVRKASLDDSLATEYIDSERTVDEVRAIVIDKWAEKQSKESNVIVGANGGAITAGKDNERDGKLRGMEECVQIRAFGVDKEAMPETEDGKRAANAAGEHRTLMGLARGYLSIAGVDHSGLNDFELHKRAMTSTDFPIALENVMNKNLKKSYAKVDPQWKKFATQVSANDFKNIYGVRVDGSFLPEEITEEGEYKMAYFKETGDNFGLKTYGIMTAVTRKMMINDDLGAFTRFAPAFANGVARNQAKIVYGLLLANTGAGRTLGLDGKTLFHADHKNLNVGGSQVMSIDAYQEADAAFMRQVGLDDEPIEVDPYFLLVPPELKIQAYKLINSTITPNTTDEVNPFKGAYEIITERFLTDPKAWYLLGHPDQIETIKYATLNGQEGIFTEYEYDFKTDNMLIKGRNDFNATIEEFVGIQKNAGGN